MLDASYDRALWALRTRLDSWPGVRHVAVGMHRLGYDLQLQLRVGDQITDESGHLAGHRAAPLVSRGQEHAGAGAAGGPARRDGDAAMGFYKKGSQ